jgi:anhydro-N-acetylmuramic acid kinase
MGGMVTALGLMSGTSLDGVDAAVIETDGVEIGRFGRRGFAAYGAEERRVLRAALGLWQGAGAGAALDAAAAVVLERHAALAAGFPEAEVAGFHGQTLAHDPAGRGTHQAGDGAALAARLGRTVVWDFRTADVASGGEGAPLVPVWHFALARHVGARAPLAFVNIGGVANVTWVDPRAAGPEVPGALLAFDTGPGNALIDDFVAARTGAARDEGGALAAAGRVDEALVAEVLAGDHVAKAPPKSLDRDAFAGLLPRLAGVPVEDGAATLAAVTAATIAAAVRWMPEAPSRWLVCGGGRLNASLMAMVAQRTNAPVAAVEAEGLDGDMLEAQAFAYLAVRVMRGLPTSFPATTGARLPVCGGRISRP